MRRNDYYSTDYSDEEDFIDYEENTLRKRFTPEEDKLLKQCVKRGKLKTWEAISQLLPGRTARQCRDRYNNYLFKQISNAKWTEEEDQIILSMYKQIGSKWTKIAKSLQGRSGNNVKNRWYKFLSKKYNLPKPGTPKTEEQETTQSTSSPNPVEITNKDNEPAKIANEELLFNDLQTIDKVFDLHIFQENVLGESFDLFTL